MRFSEMLFELMSIEVEELAAFGGLHFIFLLLVTGLSLLLIIHLSDATDKAFRIVIAVGFSVMLALEVLKQLALSVILVDGSITYDYNWDIFPFQLCSTPLYVLPMLAFLPNGHLRDAAASYIMTFALIGGVSVYLVPKTVFQTKAALNIQSMIHHGLQIVLGTFTAAYYRRRINRRFLLGGIGLFTVLYTIANLLNTIGYDMLVSFGLLIEGESFNMFYVSPRADQSIPVFEDILRKMHPSVLIVGYFVLVVIGAIIVLYLTQLITRFCDRKRRNRSYAKK